MGNLSCEQLRKEIITALLENPALGENYVDYHTDDGLCGLTLIIDGQHFDLFITRGSY